MVSNYDVSLAALKYFCGDNDDICRLCLGSAGIQAVSMEDTANIEKPYYEENITYNNIFEELYVSEFM